MINDCRRLLLGIGLALWTAGAWAAHGAVLPSAQVTDIRVGQTAGQIVVSLDKSQLLHVAQAFSEISVGNKEIADVLPVSHNLIYVLGKKYGTTNLMISGPNGRVLAVVDVVVTYDINGLKQRLHDLVPDENITVGPAGDAISLSGQVSSADHLRQILAIANHYAPDKIADMLTLGGSQQVLLEVKFAEVQRSALKDLGVTTALTNSGNGSITSAIGTGTASTAFGSITGAFTNGNYKLLATLNALQKKGLVRTLAEPNLVALSGDTASFLAGGEFPIPVAQSSSTTGGIPTVTIDYKEFGVGLSFTPTIIGKELVNLVITSEVSSLDPSLAVSANGFQIPALKVRRAKTTIELNDGESFAIAGLLQDDFSSNTNQFPLLGDVPVLGALFRSVDYQHNQTDLVIIITAHLVQPAMAKSLSTPLDTLVLPTPLEHLGTGDVEKQDDEKSLQTRENQGYVLP
jgi:pilus assembly protein CpaC